MEIFIIPEFLSVCLKLTCFTCFSLLSIHKSLLINRRTLASASVNQQVLKLNQSVVDMQTKHDATLMVI